MAGAAHASNCLLSTPSNREATNDPKVIIIRVSEAHESCEKRQRELSLAVAETRELDLPRDLDYGPAHRTDTGSWILHQFLGWATYLNGIPLFETFHQFNMILISRA